MIKKININLYTSENGNAYTQKILRYFLHQRYIEKLLSNNSMPVGNLGKNYR